jgi:hypothetical protein
MMKKLWAATTSKTGKIVTWAEKEGSDFIQNLIRDLKSLRAIFNWIYLFLYVWLIWYAATHYKESIPTAIVSTAGIVSVIFSGYIYSKKSEGSNSNGAINEIKTVPQNPEADKDEDGASA